MCNHFFRANGYFSALFAKHQQQEQRQIEITRRQLLARASALGVGLTLAEFLSMPQVAEAFDLFPMPSFNTQKKVGLEAEKQILQQYKLVDDTRVNEVKAVGAKLVAGLPEPDKSRWNYDFHLVVGKDINAFALPGGPLFFFSGLYDNMTTEDELAAVIGHEMTHVRLQHWAKAYRKEEQTELFVGAAEIFGHVGNLGQQILGLGADGWSLGYSRKEESEADHGGLQDMVASGYNPQGMIDMFNVLMKKVGNGGNSTSVYLSNHPLTTDRIKAAQDQIATLDSQDKFNPQIPIGTAAGIPPKPPYAPLNPPPAATPTPASPTDAPGKSTPASTPTPTPTPTPSNQRQADTPPDL